MEDAVPDDAVKLFKVRVADRDGRRRQANVLVQRRYAWRGYQVESATEAMAKGVTLTAFDGNDVVATISVGLDSQDGMFVDALFASEVDAFRVPGRHLCEFTKLAVDEKLRSKRVLAAIFHIAYVYARRVSGCSDLFVEVNPRHARFYARMLGFRPCGAEHVDARVGAPAVLLHLDLAHAQVEIAHWGGQPQLAAEARSLYPFFFSPQDETGIEARLRTVS